MGRGRQKAKHTKVARELKYFSPETNYGALERELASGQHAGEDYVDRWADEYEGPDEDDEFEPHQDQNKTA
ncbi:DUF3073 domain-containing protein [Curtobacterium sp. MCBA15_001]|uniref:DUF3073 domain-containing protein n=1 Tax=Curtobacterium sp. MCBA15_001 TaxID=1898731 RepID=UPI0008DD0474|nr:DUF3073 domain-containing protein [Curtobacterium sp. MCBA15_001]OIH97645.1 hypothetical protein BIU90_13800 [Curtobacterium sp. MCBA15_001]